MPGDPVLIIGADFIAVIDERWQQVTRSYEEDETGKTSKQAKEAQRLARDLRKQGVPVRDRDQQRGANEGLDDRTIKALAEENFSVLPGLNMRAIIKRCRQAGH